MHWETHVCLEILVKLLCCTRLLSSTTLWEKAAKISREAITALWCSGHPPVSVQNRLQDILPKFETKVTLFKTKGTMMITLAGLPYSAIQYLSPIISMTRMSCNKQRSVYPRHVRARLSSLRLKQTDYWYPTSRSFPLWRGLSLHRSYRKPIPMYPGYTLKFGRKECRSWSPLLQRNALLAFKILQTFSTFFYFLLLCFYLQFLLVIISLFFWASVLLLPFLFDFFF